jgi:hypothetical protein
MSKQFDPIENAIRDIGWRNKIRCGERVLLIACVVRQNAESGVVARERGLRYWC